MPACGRGRWGGHVFPPASVWAGPEGRRVRVHDVMPRHAAPHAAPTPALRRRTPVVRAERRGRWVPLLRDPASALLLARGEDTAGDALGEPG